MHVRWDGRCYLSDSKHLTLEVRGTNDQINACTPYGVNLELNAFDEECGG